MTRPDSNVGPARDALEKALRRLTPADGMKLIRRLKQAQARPGGGQRTSCTQGAQNAAVSHAFKLFKGPRFTIAKLAEPNTWRATCAGGKGL